MHSIAFLVGAAAACFAPLAAADGAAGHAWGYTTTNASIASPTHWAEYYPTCAGTRQSPIDISTTGQSSTSSLPLTFDGKCQRFSLSVNEEAYKGSVTGGSCAAHTGGATFNLLQFHMHTPSEHTLNGVALDGEVHFVHNRTDGGALLVVGAFLKAVEGATTPAFVTNVLNGMEKTTEAKPVKLKLDGYANLLKTAAKGGQVYNYPGSLTTPGCSETVDWWVVQKPVEIAPTDLTRLQQHFKHFTIYDNGKNARPVQALNQRTVAAYAA